MTFPFVTRHAFDLVDQRCKDLTQEVTELRAKYDYLMNQFIWRGTKIPLNPENLPAEYRETIVPKNEVIQDPGAVLNDAKKEPAAVLSPRARLKDVEAERERKFMEEQGKMHIVPEQEVKEA